MRKVTIVLIALLIFFLGYCTRTIADLYQQPPHHDGQHQHPHVH